MGGEGLAVLIQHLLGVAVVGGDKGHAAQVRRGLHDLGHAGVHGLHGGHGRVEDTGVAHHVAVGKVQDDDIVLAALDAANGLFRDGRGAHFRFQVIGCDLGGGDKAPVLPGEDGLLAAVEEEGHVGVFFRLGNAQLGHTQLTEVLAKDILQLLVGEGHGDIGHGGVILRGADVVDGQEAALALDLSKVGVHQGAGHLSGAVGAEVTEDDAVALFNAPALGADHRLEEFIGDSGVIRGLDGLAGVLGKGSIAVGQGIVGALHALPTAVAVHGVVAAGNVGDLADPQLPHLVLELLNEAQAGGGGDIPTV